MRTIKPKLLSEITALLWALAITGYASPPSIETFLGASSDSVSSDDIKTDPEVSTVRFQISTPGQRYRYMLQGLDESWITPSEPISVIVRFFDAANDQTGQLLFPVIGSSPGWTGNPEESLFVSRTEVLTVPETAVRLSVVTSSAGPPEALGIIAVRDVNLRRLPEGGNLGHQYITDSGIPGENTADLWGRSGTHPTMAQITGLEGDDARPVLLIHDNDTAAHADWVFHTDKLPEIIPGSQLELSWQEAYSTGIGGTVSTTYERIPAGSYRFLSETVSVEGLPTGEISTVRLIVPLPYWKSFWFWGVVAAAVAALSYLWGRRVLRRKINRNIRHAALISEERLRIARDLHDDLGTRLSHISLLGSQSEATVSDPAAKENFQEITSMSGELISALSETVWLLNSKNNDLESLVNFLCRQLGELCKLAGIRCRLDAMSVEETMPISHEFRHNFSLAAKESINNAIKHSGATEIHMNIQAIGKLLRIEIRDDGTGLDTETRSRGNGLESISQRMASIKGTSSIANVKEGGVRVLLEAPIR